MAVQAYLWHYMVAGLAFVLLGAIGHVCRAVFNVLPDRLSDRPVMDLLISDGYDLNDHLFGTEYDDAGYYRLDSWINLRNAMVFSVLGGWAVMLLAPGASGLVATAINEGAEWLWQLFLFRLGEVGIL